MPPSQPKHKPSSTTRHPFPADGRPLPDPDRVPALAQEAIPADAGDETGTGIAEAADLGIDPVELEEAVAEVEQDQRLLDPSREIEPLPETVVDAEFRRRRRQERRS